MFPGTGKRIIELNLELSVFTLGEHMIRQAPFRAY